MLQGSPRQQQQQTPGGNNSNGMKTAPSVAEDDAQDAIYLSGGWQSRLLLALQSDLPNEVDWAFNKLVKLSFTRNFFMGNLPGLQGALLDHATPFFDLLELHTSPSDFETTLKKTPTNSAVAEAFLGTGPTARTSLEEVSLFQSSESAAIIERVLQVLHIFRNLSFLQENALLFSRDHVLLTSLAKAIALPSASFFVELKKHAFDVFENMASLIQLRGSSDFYFACLKKCLFDTDRALILSAIRALTKLCVNPMNEKVILQLDALPRLVELLLVPDEELVIVIMEFLYNFSALTEGSSRIPRAAPFNIVKLLWKFVHWRGVDRGVNQPMHLMTKLPISASQPRVSGPPTGNQGQGLLAKPTPNAMANQDPSNPFFNAALWLTLHHELAPGFTVPSRDFFATYQAYCRAEGRPVLPLGDLIVVVKAVFKDIETFRVGPPPVFTGFRLKNLAQSVNAPVSAPSVAGSPITAGSPLAASPMPSNGAQTPIPRAESTESLVSQKTEDNNPPSVSDQQNVPGMMDIDPLDSQSTVKKGDWACCWGHLSQGRVPECQESFASREDLFLHVRDAHLPESLSTYTCAWNGCFRISQSSRREQLVSHVGIHLLELSKGKKEMANGGYAPSPVAGVPPRSVSRPSATGLGLSSGTPQSHVFPDPNDELRGIPLTALLVLRNLARHPDNRSLYYPFEHELANLLAHHRYSKLVSSILVEL